MYVFPADFIEFGFSVLIYSGLLAVFHKGKSVVEIEQAGNAYWLIGRSGGIKTIIDRVTETTQLEVYRKAN